MLHWSNVHTRLSVASGVGSILGLDVGIQGAVHDIKTGSSGFADVDPFTAGDTIPPSLHIISF